MLSSPAHHPPLLAWQRVFIVTKQVMVFSRASTGSDAPAPLQKAQREKGLTKCISQGTLSAASDQKKKRKKRARTKSLLPHTTENSRDGVKCDWVLVLSLY